jgi:hypothetical protein
VRKIDAWRLAYTGSMAAMIPGISAAFASWIGLLVGSALAAAIVASSWSIRTCLKETIWYRVYFAAVFLATLVAAGLVAQFPAVKSIVVVGWLVATIVVLLVFWPFIAEMHGSERSEN